MRGRHRAVSFAAYTLGMKRTLLALLLAATTSLTAAQSGGTLNGLTVSGTVSGPLPAQARIGGFTMDPGGQPVSELASVPVTGSRFSIDLPSVLPPQRTLVQLRPDAIFWPGVLEPVTVQGQASIAELRFYVYGDGNGNGRRDDTEGLQETSAFVGKSVLVVSFASSASQVGAARGFQANLKPGWNGLLIDVGRAVKVTSSGTVNGVTVNTQR
ncbi:hypothetical protein GCM10008939_02300 [Deinococcus aquiradiocola]|uniref:Carboxypeptidase regulatory-like domain-containing protein n=2 Tax=Deinococcus aquiradiocola TaxID=393059 RepID=A0A917P535_9DEIO|nr:hypothetical protein GCM10008939_02300 [Deinococcus aquiradiocola]